MEKQEDRNGTGRYRTPKEDAMFCLLAAFVFIVGSAVGWCAFHYGPVLEQTFWRWLKSL